MRLFKTADVFVEASRRMEFFSKWILMNELFLVTDGLFVENIFLKYLRSLTIFLIISLFSREMYLCFGDMVVLRF